MRPHMSAFGGKADMAFALQMSAYDPKRTSLVALHMSAFGGKADMADMHREMSANDPKRKFFQKRPNKKPNANGLANR